MDTMVKRIIIGGILFAAALILPITEGVQLALYFISYVIVGGEVVIKAIRNIVRGRVFDEHFLMTIATVGAFLIGEYPEGVAVMLFYLIGETFQDHAVGKSRKSIASLMDIRPDFANVQLGDRLVKTKPDEVSVGDVIVVKAGERVPLDSRVIEGNSLVDTSALTGESVPREIAAGSELLSGCVNLNGALTAEVTKGYQESTVSRILDLVENASSKKAQSEKFITKFARYYTPIVVITAAILAVVPPLIIEGAVFSDWVYRALAFLVVSCPCALVISIPLSFFGGIGGAARNGILVKGSNHLEALAQAEIVVFDKTGTLTKGVFDVKEVHAEGISEEELLGLAAHAESYSNHPISESLIRAYGREPEYGRISNFEELPGYGVEAVVDGKDIAVGNDKLMDKLNIQYSQSSLAGTVAHVAADDAYLGFIVIADEVKADSKDAIKDLERTHVRKTVMLTGDRSEVGEQVATELGLDTVYSKLLPGGKLDKLEELFAQKNAKGKVVFVGDGINDAPVLARADVGIAMGSLGSDAAIEAADIALMTDEPSKVAVAIQHAKRTLLIVRQNIAFSLAVKAAVLGLSAFGLTSLWGAVFADVGVTFIVVLNSLRAMKVV